MDLQTRLKLIFFLCLFLAGLLPGSSGAASNTNYEFIRQVIQCLKIVHDANKEGGMPYDPGSAILKKGGPEIQKLMQKWTHSTTPHVSEAAQKMLSAGSSMEKMAIADRNILQGIGDVDEQRGIFRRERGNLNKKVLASAQLVTNKYVPLSRDEKARIVRLIETQLFPKEVQEYDKATYEAQQGYISVPELYAAMAFRTVYKRDLQK